MASLVRRQGIALALLAVILVAIATPAQAHGTSRIRDHRFISVDGSVKVRGTYVTSKRHAHLSVTAFIIQGDHIRGEKTRRCSTCRSIHVQLKVPCRQSRPVYAVLQGDVRKGHHFAIWNSKVLVCE